MLKYYIIDNTCAINRSLFFNKLSVLSDQSKNFSSWWKSVHHLVLGMYRFFLCFLKKWAYYMVIFLGISVCFYFILIILSFFIPRYIVFICCFTCCVHFRLWLSVESLQRIFEPAFLFLCCFCLFVLRVIIS